jgi:MFS family permease
MAQEGRQMNGSNTVREPTRDVQESEKSLSELARQLSDQSSALARKEIELAKAEMAVKAKRLGIGAGAFGAAGLVALFAFGALTATLILALATAMDGWIAALIVTALYGAVAGVLALIGRKRVQAGTPPVPERAIESSKQDVETAKQRMKEARG